MLRNAMLAVGLLLGFCALTAPLVTKAQQAGKVPRIGVLTSSIIQPRVDAFLAGLRDSGYVDGQNIVIEWRRSDGRAERLPNLAADLVRLKVDVIVAVDNPSIVSAQRATRTIPIVMVLATDPVGMGFIASLARPGGNITGLANQATELQGKALQLLKEVIPAASRVAVLWDSAEDGRRANASEAELAAPKLGLHAQLWGAANVADLDGFFTAMTQDRPDAVLIQPGQINFTRRARIAELAAKRHLPTMGWSAETVEAGWLMSYGPNILSLFRRSGYYVGKTLTGVLPADLPVEQPTKFEFVINLKTAKALGLKIPQSILLRADRVIE